MPVNILTDTDNQLIQFYVNVRSKTEKLCQPLFTEDYVIQSISDVSPPKWHLAHTTWFFETFILIPYFKNYRPFNPLFHYLFNSYYYQVGGVFPRTHRGILSRPTVDTVYSYRHYVDKHLTEFMDSINEELFLKLENLVMLGIHHEQQHQELLLMDIKHNFSVNVEYPVYQSENHHAENYRTQLHWFEIEGKKIEIGHTGDQFSFDNELPRHAIILEPYSISSRLVMNAEWIEFIDAGGYQNPKWWLSDGWDWVQKNQIIAPLYWQFNQKDWYIFTLNGLKKLNLAEPVCHVSFYEADAFARFQGCRLPREAEWEYFVFSQQLKPETGNFLESHCFHPKANSALDSPVQFFGDAWEWTLSPYSSYPGYKPLPDALGEYNGKFMSNQMVLRGGSCVTPMAHIRISYRNFFQPEKRWQFSGLRLAKDLK